MHASAVRTGGSAGDCCHESVPSGEGTRRSERPQHGVICGKCGICGMCGMCGMAPCCGGRCEGWRAAAAVAAAVRASSVLSPRWPAASGVSDGGAVRRVCEEWRAISAATSAASSAACEPRVAAAGCCCCGCGCCGCGCCSCGCCVE
eukprot:scaffold85739_cov51-Phaeocystis_antarctica.AAC.1